MDKHIYSYAIHLQWDNSSRKIVDNYGITTTHHPQFVTRWYTSMTGMMKNDPQSWIQMVAECGWNCEFYLVGGLEHEFYFPIYWE